MSYSITTVPAMKALIIARNESGKREQYMLIKRYWGLRFYQGKTRGDNTCTIELERLGVSAALALTDFTELVAKIMVREALYPITTYRTCGTPEELFPLRVLDEAAKQMVNAAVAVALEGWPPLI